MKNTITIIIIVIITKFIYVLLSAGSASDYEAGKVNNCVGHISVSMITPTDVYHSIAIGVIAESVRRLTWGRHFVVEWSAPPGQWRCKLDQRQWGAYGYGVCSTGKRQLLRSHWLH